MKASFVACCAAAALSVSCQSAAPTEPSGPPGAVIGPGMTMNGVVPVPQGGNAGAWIGAAVGGMSGPAVGSGGAAPDMSVPTAGSAGSDGSGTPASREDEIEAMRDPAKDAWMGFGGSLEQTFARPSAAIEKSNLSMLGEAWEKTAPGGVTGTPAIYGGVVYWTDWVGNVHANKLSDGSEVWSKKYMRGFTSSPFVTDDGVYLSNRDNMVYKLNRLTGEEVWSVSTTEAKLAHLWSSPTVVDGVVIVGIGGKGTSDGGIPYTQTELRMFHGGVIGIDAMTGAVRWKFDNTVGPDGTQFGPGVSSWSSPAVDTVRKVAYIGSGNSYYSPASPYSDSILALDYMTTEPKGKLVWSHQFTMNDNFTSGAPYGPDSDVGATPNLYSLDGKDYVAVGDKGGRFYILDRETGDLLSTTPAGNGSATGGVMAPAAYGDGALYQAANATGTTLVQRINAKTGESEWSTTLLSGVCFSAPLLLKDVLLVGTNSGFPSARPSPATIVALDRETGDPVPGWSLSLPHQRGGGLAIYHNTLIVPYGFVFENTNAETNLMGGVLAAAIGGKPIEPETTGPVATHAPTYSALYDEVLEPQGCTADRCHGGLGLKIANKMAGHASLMSDVGVSTCAGMKFVVPGQPEQSLLYRKVVDDMPPCGAKMPLGLAPLKPEEIAQLKMWIELGAPND
jgi:outer membrane protein assembly factor BamB